MRVSLNVLLDFVYIFYVNTRKLIIWILKPYASFSILWCKYRMYRKDWKCYFSSLCHKIPDNTYILFYIFIVAQHERFYFLVLLHLFRFLFVNCAQYYTSQFVFPDFCVKKATKIPDCMTKIRYKFSLTIKRPYCKEKMIH